MKVRVLRQFDYAADGIRAVTLTAGSEAELHDDLVPGLQLEGFVAPIGAVPVVAEPPPTAETVPVSVKPAAAKTPAKRGRRKRS